MYELFQSLIEIKDGFLLKPMDLVLELLKSAGYAKTLAWVIGLYWAFSVLIGKKQNPTVAGASVQGKRWSWEPALSLQIRFVAGAYDIISSGYNKAC